ncbi:hypothetical protein COO91_01141 [Nostoc flagelliforme CCNUN1]|uniref:Uncharacterized protein n=2 Tax=Nostoc flagelliforme TaxID=1306274 RepID=A0A2K8SKA6_9NOSO|nr:hypothetical protein COO91_01141 [Nostoc flagelliforme CCNUN1]
MTGILNVGFLQSRIDLDGAEVATVPRESLEIYEQILIGESNPENSAWIEYLDKCIAVE